MDYKHCAHIHHRLPGKFARSAARIGRHRFLCARWLVALALLLTSLSRAQLICQTNNGAVTIMGYNGSPTVVVIPNFTNTHPVVSIAMQAFLDKTTLTSIMLSTNLGSIGYQAFGGCSSLTSITLPNSITNLPDYNFEPCASLTNVTLSDRLRIIPEEMCGECTALASITIPGSVTNIQQDAFDQCNNLTAVYCLGNEPTTNKNVFFVVNAAVAKVYYNAGANGWGTTFDGLPTVMLSPTLAISNAMIKSNRFEFNFSGTNNQTVVIQASTNLAQPTWQALLTNILSGTSSNYSDAKWTNYPYRYYRLYSP